LLHRCASREEVHTPSDTSPKFQVPKTLAATTPDGRSVKLQNGGATDFVILATWCPYSKQLKRFLNDPITRPFATRRKLIFLFSNNEWPDVETELKEPGKSAAQLKQELAKLRAQSGSNSLFDPSFLDDVPGDVYLCDLPKEMDGFPSVISGTGRDQIGWMAVDLNMPERLLLPTFKKYAPKK
jgi:hypothetical protein